MSPRSTKSFHHLGHGQHFCPVGLIGFERGDLCGELSAAAKVADLTQKCRPDGLGLTPAGRLESPESLVRFDVETYRYRPSHDPTVYHIL